MKAVYFNLNVTLYGLRKLKWIRFIYDEVKISSLLIIVKYNKIKKKKLFMEFV